MNKKYFSFLLVIYLFGCGIRRHQSKAEKQLEEIYIQEFRTTYFKTLLKKGFNNDPKYIEAVSIDASHYGEIILDLEDYQLIDSLTNIDNDIMVKDSIDRIGKVAEGAEGKKVFYYALDKYNSHWLDSITKVRLKRFQKFEKEW